ncbi:MAG: polysaccharide biosynthesis protein [Chitinophagia bacterium]|nr:polysaccharide biosynthesis protein [Chitinophagia bacterium]
MSGIKKLAGQTLWYGVPSVASRFLGYLMNLSLPLLFKEPAITADLTLIYAAVAFLNIIYTYGLETAYFRFSQTEDRSRLYSTLSIALFFSSSFFSAVLWYFQDTLAQWGRLGAHTEYIRWMIGILFLDSLSTLAFAKLRQENRPRRYALTRLSSVIINIAVVVIFLGIVPRYLALHPDTPLAGMYRSQESGIVWFLVGNFLGSLFCLLLLSREWMALRWMFDPVLFKKVMRYAWPLVLVGMGGIANDMLGRLLYQFVVDLPVEEAKHQLGVFGNIVRLSIVITIAIQAFRMAAEPFFFNRSQQQDAPQTYARIMNYFVIVCCFLFLGLSLYIDVIKWFFESIDRSRWTEGLYVVPLIAMANIFLGIYYNLSIWYKLTNNNFTGALITIGGTLITVVLTTTLIPSLGYLGAALASFSCYFFMMISSYLLGQKKYPVPYPVKKIVFYLLLSSSLFGLHRWLLGYVEHPALNLGLATVLLAVFAFVVKRKEQFQ